MEEKHEVKVQRETQSWIWKLGLIGVIAEGVLGVLLVAGVIAPEIAGAIMTGFAGLMAYVNGNNPNIKGQYNVQPEESDG